MKFLSSISVFILHGITIIMAAPMSASENQMLVRASRESQSYDSENEEQMFREDFEEPGYKVVDPLVIYVNTVEEMNVQNEETSIWLDVLAMVGVILVCCCCFCWFLKRKKNSGTPRQSGVHVGGSDIISPVQPRIEPKPESKINKKEKELSKKESITSMDNRNDIEFNKFGGEIYH